MAYPEIQSADTQSGTQTSDSTSWTLTYPTNLAEGNLILAVLAIDGFPTVTFPAGWVTRTRNNAGFVSLAASKKKSTGTETGNFTVTLGTAEQGSWRVYRITNWFGLLGTAFQNGATSEMVVANENTSGGDPPSLDPNNWNGENALWVPAVAVDASGSITAYPYSSTQSTDVSGGAGGATLAVCSTTSEASSEDPADYGASTTAVSITIGVRGTATKPTFVQASTGATDASGAWTATGIAPALAGNVVIFQLLQDGNSTSQTITSATNIENLAGTDNAWTSIGKFAIGGSTQANQHLWIGRSINLSAPTATGDNAGGNDGYWRMYEFAGCHTGTTLAELIENATAGSTVNSAGTSATVADASVQTLGTNRLALNFVAGNDDNALDAFTGMTGGTWVEAVAEYANSSGTDGVIQLQIAAMASAGTIDGGSDGWADATDSWGVVGFALIGTTPSFTPRNPAVNFQDPALLMKARDAWERSRGILVPRLWTPEGATI